MNHKMGTIKFKMIYNLIGISMLAMINADKISTEQAL